LGAGFARGLRLLRSRICAFGRESGEHGSVRRSWVVLVLVASAALLAVACASAAAPACAVRGTCDCEATDARPIRQPANAWSSLALAGAGAWAATRARRGPDTMLGVALAATGFAAFSYHATLSGWGARIDAAAIVVLAGVAAAHRWDDVVPFPYGAAGASLTAAGAVAIGAADLAAIALAVVAVAGHVRRRCSGDIRPALGAAAALAVGALLWWMGERGGPWCESGTWAQPHAAWHLAAAVGGLLAIAYVRSCEAAGGLYSAGRDAHDGGP